VQFIAFVLLSIELPVFNGGQIVQAKGANQPEGEQARRRMSQGANKPGGESARGRKNQG